MLVFGPTLRLLDIHFPKKKPPPPPPPTQVPGWFLWAPQQVIRSFGQDVHGYHEFTELAHLAGDVKFNINTAFGPYAEALANTVATAFNSWVDDWNIAVQTQGAPIREIDLACPAHGVTAAGVTQIVLESGAGHILGGFGNVNTQMLKVSVQKATSRTTPYNGPFTLT